MGGTRPPCLPALEIGALDTLLSSLPPLLDFVGPKVAGTPQDTETQRVVGLARLAGLDYQQGTLS